MQRVAFRYATKDRSVDAVVALSPGPKYLGIDSNADVAELKARRMLLLASKEELSAIEPRAPDERRDDGWRRR